MILSVTGLRADPSRIKELEHPGAVDQLRNQLVGDVLADFGTEPEAEFEGGHSTPGAHGRGRCVLGSED